VIKAVWDEGFKKSYKKRIKTDAKLNKKFWENMELFLDNPFSSPLRTHKLSGKLRGYWAFSVAEDCRLIFEFIGENRVLLVDIGSHDDVY
jgi:addiction module RelE/StbE family toxin